MEDKKLAGKVAVITGSTKGIGLAIAKRMGEAGARIALNGRTSPDAEKVKKAMDDLARAGIEARYYACDISSSAAVKDRVDKVLKDFSKIDILVNNAGITGIPKPITEVPEEEYDSVLKTDLYGTFFTMKYVLMHMKERNYGRIVNISSIAGKEGNPNMAAYCSAKHGVVGLTKSAARELLDYDIRINAVCPVLIETEIIDDWPKEQVELLKSRIPLGRLGRVEEVADLVFFIASSEAANFITGQAFDLSGGRADY